jgi:predicted nucleotidyltransferase
MPTSMVIFVVDDNDEVCDVTELTPADTRAFLRKARVRCGTDGEACTSVDHAARHFFYVASYEEPNDQELFGANILLQRLVEQGHLVEKKNDNPKDTDTHALTPEGIRLCTKKLIPRISRAKADQLVAELLQRAAEINRRGELTECVASIYVFGSYLTDSDSLGDIDITIELERRHDDWEHHEAVNEARIKASGRDNLSFIDRLGFGEHEVQRLLKGRVRHLSVHSLSEVKRIGTPYRQIFPFEGRIVKPKGKANAD